MDLRRRGCNHTSRATALGKATGLSLSRQKANAYWKAISCLGSGNSIVDASDYVLWRKAAAAPGMAAVNQSFSEQNVPFAASPTDQQLTASASDADTALSALTVLMSPLLKLPARDNAFLSRNQPTEYRSSTDLLNLQIQSSHSPMARIWPVLMNSGAREAPLMSFEDEVDAV